MTDRDPVKIRLDLITGHWVLGEYEDALGCLDRVNDRGGRERAGALLRELLDAEPPGDPAEKLRAALLQLEAEQPTALATPTMATLLEQQGHEQQARIVAEDALRRNPDDARARAVLSRLGGERDSHAARIHILEDWLDYFRQRNQGVTHA